jgi:hypothetical protein
VNGVLNTGGAPVADARTKKLSVKRGGARVWLKSGNAEGVAGNAIVLAITVGLLAAIRDLTATVVS